MESRLQKAQLNKELEANALAYLQATPSSNSFATSPLLPHYFPSPNKNPCFLRGFSFLANAQNLWFRVL